MGIKHADRLDRSGGQFTSLRRPDRKRKDVGRYLDESRFVSIDAVVLKDERAGGPTHRWGCQCGRNNVATIANAVAGGIVRVGRRMLMRDVVDGLLPGAVGWTGVQARRAEEYGEEPYPPESFEQAKGTLAHSTV